MFEINCDILDHPRFTAAPPLGFVVWVRSIGYTAEHGTDGFIPSDAVPGLLRGVTDSLPSGAAMVACVLWRACPGGYRIRYQGSLWRVPRRRR